MPTMAAAVIPSQGNVRTRPLSLAVPTWKTYSLLQPNTRTVSKDGETRNDVSVYKIELLVSRTLRKLIPNRGRERRQQLVHLKRRKELSKCRKKKTCGTPNGGCFVSLMPSKTCRENAKRRSGDRRILISLIIYNAFQ